MEVFYAGHDKPEGVPDDHALLLKNPFLRAEQMAAYVRMHGIDLVYMQTSAGIWYAPYLALMTRAKIGVDFHSRRYQEEHVYKKRSNAHTAFMEALELFLCRSLSFGTSVAGTITAYYGRAVPRMLTLPVGVDIKKFSPDSAAAADIVSWKGSATLLAYAGNTKWYQGVEGILEAFAKLSKKTPGAWKFLVVASSGVEDVITYAKEHGLENDMRILDKQPHDAIPSLLNSADILTVVRPSDMVTEFSFPSKLSEYAALGKALVVSRVSDIESYIRDGENGVVVAPGDPAGLLAALQRLSDAGLRTRLGSNARRLAEERLDLTVLGGTLTRFLVGILS